MYPENLRYTKEHEWAKLEGSLIRVGITDFAQESLGDIVYVDLPAVGSAVTAGQPMGEVESTKSVSDLYAPISGTVQERNGSLEDTPELINQEPYGQGWMVIIEPQRPEDLDALLDAPGYERLLDSTGI